jgi:hypothetical protein
MSENYKPVMCVLKNFRQMPKTSRIFIIIIFLIELALLDIEMVVAVEKRTSYTCMEVIF